MIGQKMTSFKTIFLPKIPRILFFLHRFFDDFCDRKKLLFKSSVIQSQYAAEAEDCDRDTTG